MTEQPAYTNRLIHEKSPYLLQHAHNPVDWHPWGDEAFVKAKEDDKPIFLSIGYATCHWCHVMEHESFEDPQIAQMLNETFINIKVDREELPEVDNLYMDFAQSMMAGAAGWPLNIILTPALRPFFATTYLPPISSHGMIGLNDLIARIKEVWVSDERERIEEQSETIVSIFNENIHAQGDELPRKDEVVECADILFKLADPINGGMRGSPKFPIGYHANFMLRYLTTSGDSRAIFFVEKTLDMMHRGGIYDHLGGGFARYSVDEEWQVPHFEKMLYDNALLINAYTEAWSAVKKDEYQKVAQEIISYILRDMTHPDGGFYSAEDADSEGEEGRFYTWTEEEVAKVLGETESRQLRAYFEVTPNGNFEGRNVLHTPLSLEEFAAHIGEPSAEQLESLIDEQRQALWNAREQREHPLKDDKIITSWNGIMIDAIARAAITFQKPSYLEAASRAARFIREHLSPEKGKLYRRWRDNEALYPGSLDDYAFMIKALITLFEAGLGVEWLDWALELNTTLKEEFKSPDGAYYQTDGQDANLLLRKCLFADGAEPSGNAIQCENLMRLYQITQNEEHLTYAEDILKAAKRYIDNYPPGYTYHMMNLNRFYDPKKHEIVIALDEKKSCYDELKKLLGSHYIPHCTVVWFFSGDKKIVETIPSLYHKKVQKGKTTLYLCKKGECQQPISTIEEMREVLEKI